MALKTYSPDANRIIHNTKVDFASRSNIFDPVHLVQYDDRLPILAVSLYNGGEEYAAPSTADANIRLSKKGHKFVSSPALGCSTDRKTIYFEISLQMMVDYGKTWPIIELVIGDQVAGSSPILFIIDKNPIQEGDIESTDEFKNIEGYVQEAKDAATQANSSKTAAANSASAAKQSEMNANASKTAAANSASSASQSASEANASKAAAATSASEANVAKNAASASAEKAAVSETNAKRSEQLARDYALSGVEVSESLRQANTLYDRLLDSDGLQITDSNGEDISSAVQYATSNDLNNINQSLSVLESMQNLFNDRINALEGFLRAFNGPDGGMETINKLSEHAIVDSEY